MAKKEKKVAKMKTKTKLPIDWARVRYLLQAGCSGLQISSSIGVCSDTLYTRCVDEQDMTWRQFSEKHLQIGNSVLLETQFDSAIKSKDRGMMIWLGKQRLGQREPDKAYTEDARAIVLQVVDYKSIPDKKPIEIDTTPLDSDD